MKSILFFLFFCLGLYVKADNVSNLVVWAKDGTQVAYSFSEKPEITFSERDLVITANGIEVNYALSNMAKITYELNGYNAIRDLKTDKISYKLDGETLVFPNLSPNCTVSLYYPNGTIVYNRKVKLSGVYVIPLTNLNAGVYLVTVNGITFKIFKR